MRKIADTDHSATSISTQVRTFAVAACARWRPVRVQKVPTPRTLLCAFTRMCTKHKRFPSSATDTPGINARGSGFAAMSLPFPPPPLTHRPPSSSPSSLSASASGFSSWHPLALPPHESRHLRPPAPRSFRCLLLCPSRRVWATAATSEPGLSPRALCPVPSPAVTFPRLTPP